MVLYHSVIRQSNSELSETLKMKLHETGEMPPQGGEIRCVIDSFDSKWTYMEIR